MKRKALGKGLSALLPDPDGAAGPRRRRRRGPGRPPRAQPAPAAHRDRPAAARGAGRLDPGERDRAADPGAAARRALPDHRRRAALARRPAARAWPRVPVVVRDVPDDRLLELALVENIQRQELTPLEEAQAFQRLQEELRLTQEEVARKVGPRPLHGRQHAAPAAAAARGARAARRGRARRRPRARAAGPRARRGPGRARPRGGAQAGSRCARWSGGWRSCARPAAASGSARGAQHARRGGAPARGARHARARSRGAGKGGRSASRSRARPSCNRLFELLVRAARRASAADGRATCYARRGARVRGAGGSMIKIKGLAAEDLNGFMDEGTEFDGRAALPRHVPHRRPAEGPHRLGQHADRGRVGPGGRRDRLRRGLDPRHGHAAGSRARSASSSWPAARVQATWSRPSS